jgi:hypothetical protein
VSALLTSLPLVLVGLTTVVLGVLVSREVRDEAVVEAVRLDVRRLGEAHRAACESRAGHLVVDARSDALRRPGA